MNENNSSNPLVSNVTDNRWMKSLQAFDRSVWILVVANLLPLVGVFFFGWDARLILFIYWGENLVVGLLNVLKMVCIRGGVGENSTKLFMIPFFMVHFGGFCAVHGVFLVVLTSEFGSGGVPGEQGGVMSSLFPDSSFWIGPLMFIGLLFNLVSYIWSNYFQQIWLPILSLLFSHGYSFYENFIVPKKYLDRSLAAQMFAPYGRIVVMHVAILTAGMLVVVLGSPTPLIVVLVGMKIVIDVVAHQIASGAGLPMLTSFLKNRVQSHVQNRQGGND